MSLKIIILGTTALLIIVVGAFGGYSRLTNSTDKKRLSTQNSDVAPLASTIVPDWQTYTADETGYRISYPSFWEFRKGYKSPDTYEENVSILNLNPNYADADVHPVDGVIIRVEATENITYQGSPPDRRYKISEFRCFGWQPKQFNHPIAHLYKHQRCIKTRPQRGSYIITLDIAALSQRKLAAYEETAHKVIQSFHVLLTGSGKR